MSDPTPPYPGGEPPQSPSGAHPPYPGATPLSPGGSSPQYPGAAPQGPGGASPAYPVSSTPAYPGSGIPQYPAGGGQQPPPGGGYPAPPQGPMGSYGQDDGKGFFAALFDFSFNSFVTPKIVKFVYVLATIAIGLFVLIFVIASFADSAGAGLVVLFLAPIVGLIYLAFIRMGLEFCFALVRMSDDIHARR